MKQCIICAKRFNDDFQFEEKSIEQLRIVFNKMKNIDDMKKLGERICDECWEDASILCDEDII